MLRLVGDINRAYQENRGALAAGQFPGRFRWIDANDAGNNVFSWLRWSSDNEAVACLANFSAVPHVDYRVGLPFGGEWTEIVNTDAAEYGGSGVGNLGQVFAWEDPGTAAQPRRRSRYRRSASSGCATRGSTSSLFRNCRPMSAKTSHPRALA